MLISLLSIVTASAWIGSQDPVRPPVEPDPVQVEDVEVTGRRDGSPAEIETRIDDFVESVAAPSGHFGPARWHRRLCVGAVNFQPDAARQMVDRVSEVALELGLSPGDPGCKPHVMIFATNDGPGMASALIDRDRPLFVGRGSGMDLGAAALRDFQTGDRAVRWWHVSVPVDADIGQRVTRRPADNVGLTNNLNPPNVSFKFTASRLRSQVRDDLRNIVIIVDTDQLGEASFAQVADYVAMLAMAQIAPEADTRRHESILNLFHDPTAVSGLTRWDMAYLRGLYAADLDTVAQNSRLGAVERSMQAGLME